MARFFIALIPLLLAIACAQIDDTQPAPTESASPTATPTIAANPTPVDAARQPSPSRTPTPTSLTVAFVVNIVDGDTIDVLINGQKLRVRYIGIDTPETVDPRRPVECFGREASERNRQLVEGKTVGLERDISETDRFGRRLRYVWLEGEMVNAILVAGGYASAVTFPPDVRYAELFAALEARAREDALGLWGPACATPSPPPVGNGPCDYSGSDEPVIKGNISVNSGEKIYHVPGGEFYDKTVIDEAKGERWFCTETEARAAGWRRSKL